MEASLSGSQAGDYKVLQWKLKLRGTNRGWPGSPAFPNSSRPSVDDAVVENSKPNAKLHSRYLLPNIGIPPVVELIEQKSQ